MYTRADPYGGGSFGPPRANDYYTQAPPQKVHSPPSELRRNELEYVYKSKKRGDSRPETYLEKEQYAQYPEEEVGFEVPDYAQKQQEPQRPSISDEQPMDLSGVKEKKMWDQSSIEHESEQMNQTAAVAQMFDKPKGGSPTRQEMYAQMYKKVIEKKESVRKQATARDPFYKEKDYNAYDTYKQEWQQMQQKYDYNLQKERAERNRVANHRMQAYSQSKETAQRAEFRRRQIEHEKLKECSFSPQINRKKPRIENFDSRELDEGHFSKSPRRKKHSPERTAQNNFYQREQEFLKRKNSKIEAQRRNQDQQLRSMQKTKLVSKNSERIWNNRNGSAYSSVGSQISSPPGEFSPFDEEAFDAQPIYKSVKSIKSTSSSKQTVGQFINRNYYQVHQQKKEEQQKAKRRYRDHVQTSRSKDSATYRTLSSHRHSVNSRGASVSSKTSGVSGVESAKSSPHKDKPFHPTISETSSQMSRQKGKSVFKVLHQEGSSLTRKREAAQQQAYRNFQRGVKDSFANNMGDKSDLHLVQLFRKDFDAVMKDQLSQGPQLYLLDAMEDLKFLDQEYIGKNYADIEGLLQDLRLSLIVDVGDNRGPIQSNLFQICCAILHLKGRRAGQPLEDRILRSYITNIDLDNRDPHMVLIDRLVCIKNLINRPEFQLTERQMRQIHAKFVDFSHQRKDALFEEKKRKRAQKVIDEENAKYYPIPKVQPLMQRSPAAKEQTSRASQQLVDSSGRAEKYSEQMYKYHQVQREYREKLKEWYDQKDEIQVSTELSFNPQLNTKSLKMAHSAKGLIQRTDEMAGKRRTDRDPRDREYNEQLQECTFKPTINSGLPKARAPAPLQRSFPAKQSQQYAGRKEEQSPEMRVTKGLLPERGSKPEMPQRKWESYLKNTAEKPSQAANPIVPRRAKPRAYSSGKKFYSLESELPTVEEPICVLKIELDGAHVEEIKVFENDDPVKIVETFGEEFNLSERAKARLLEQIEQQIQMDEEY